MNFILRTQNQNTRTYRANTDYVDPEALYYDARNIIYNLIVARSPVLRLRLIICLNVLFYKITEDEERDNQLIQSFYFCSFAERILSRFQILSAIDRAFIKILKGIENFVKNGSGWVLKQISFIDVHIGDYRVIRGGCGHISLPKKLKNKKCLINIQCSDQKCFIYCITACLYPCRVNQNKVYKYKKFLKNFNLNGIKFPMTLNKISKFEKLNKLKVNVYSFEENYVLPLRVSQVEKAFTEIDLLLYRGHYFFYKKF